MPEGKAHAVATEAALPLLRHDLAASNVVPREEVAPVVAPLAAGEELAALVVSVFRDGALDRDLIALAGRDRCAAGVVVVVWLFVYRRSEFESANSIIAHGSS